MARGDNKAARKLDAFEALLPDSRAFFQRNFATWPAQLAACLAWALALRIVTFGDPAIHIDEGFYFLVGQRMHLGELPYVDLWDRKPFGLFALFYLFAGISNSVIVYQVAAWLSASLTAFVIVRLSTRWTGPQGALLAGLAYCALLNTFGGIGGQTPVFYNLLIAAAALLLVHSIDRLRVGAIPLPTYGAVALCGVAMTIKQTTLFESVFFGLVIVWILYRSGQPFPWLRIALLAIIAAVPTLSIAAFYYLSGHWFEFWGAMVTSNLAKKPAAGFQYLSRGLSLLIQAAPIALLVVFALRGSLKGAYRPFLVGWTIAAFVGFFSVPNLYSHYLLPVMVPFAAVAATELNRRTLGILALGLIASLAAISSQAYDLSRHRKNADNMDALADMIREHAPRGSLLAYDAPPMLFSLSGARPLSPLLFPNHNNDEIERNVSHLDTSAEFRRVLATKPGAVALANFPRVRFYNRETRALVLAYVRDHCRLVGSAMTYEFAYDDPILIYGDCN